MRSRSLPSLALLTILFSACGSESTSGDAVGETGGGSGVGIGGSGLAGDTSSQAGTPVNAGGATLVGQGGASVLGQGGASVLGQGGASVLGQGGASVLGQGGASVGAGGNTTSTCAPGIQTGNDCNPTADTGVCERSDRTCLCDAGTSTWTCTPNDGAGGSGSGGATTTGEGGGTESGVGGGTNTGEGGTNTGEGGVTGSGGSGLGGSTGVGGSTDSCAPYTWPGYTPNLDFQFDATGIEPSGFTVYQGCDASEVAGTLTSGWWSVIWGHDRNPEITDAQLQTVLDGLNEDLGYIRDQMFWPPDKMAQDGHFSSVYVHGSGLCTDEDPNTVQGGWQAWVGSYAMVDLTWAPIVNYDRGGITHEAIHAMVKGTPGGNIKVPWFNEGGNTWIQMQLGAQRDGEYGVGFLDGVPFLAPHQPIECYSGWLLDGSFGGPGAEGVTDCSWRRHLGGTQYNAIFPHFMALYLSPGSNQWVWQEPEHARVLESLASGLGEAQIRHLIMEYRARTALLDFGPWSEAIYRDGIRGYWGQTVNAECGSTQVEDYQLGAYAPTTTSGSTITPDEYTLPGWSGANQIPLNVSGDQVRLNFTPEGANMRIQLAYWAEDGTAVYSQPAETGEVCLRLDKRPQNDVVIAVVSNTDYIYTGDSIRHAKYPYTVDMVEGATSTADRTEQWFVKE